MDKSGKLILKILLIDDDEIFFNLLKGRFSKEGMYLLWARDGLEGIKKARLELPDVVVTDIVMPKVNGFEVIRALKEKPSTKNICYIVLTNYGETRLVYDKEFLGSLGIHKYLIKSNHTPIEIVKEIKVAISACPQLMSKP
jgi:two-component system alkaline phosphatase synthesis response regulator PhoP